MCPLLLQCSIIISDFRFIQYNLQPQGLYYSWIFMESKSFLLISQQSATYSSPQPDESSQCPPIPLKTPPILSSHPCLDLLSDFFSSGFYTKTQHALFFSPMHVTWPTHLIFLDLNFQIIFNWKTLVFDSPYLVIYPFGVQIILVTSNSLVKINFQENL
jgi:hypothetical protein